MPLDVVVVMDPIGSIKIAKDSTFAMLLEAQRRGHRLLVRAARAGCAVRDGQRAGHGRARCRCATTYGDWLRTGTAVTDCARSAATWC